MARLYDYGHPCQKAQGNDNVPNHSHISWRRYHPRIRGHTSDISFTPLTALFGPAPRSTNTIQVAERESFFPNWTTLRHIGPNQSSTLGESNRVATRTEDAGRRDDLEETFRTLRQRLRYIHLIQGEPWRTDYSETRRSQRETHGKQTPSAQHPDPGRSGCWRGSRDRLSGVQTVLDILLFGYWWQGPANRNRRGARWPGRRHAFQTIA
jgi:hypothetical protein